MLLDLIVGHTGLSPEVAGRVAGMLNAGANEYELKEAFPESFFSAYEVSDCPCCSCDVYTLQGPSGVISTRFLFTADSVREACRYGL